MKTAQDQVREAAELHRQAARDYVTQTDISAAIAGELFAIAGKLPDADGSDIAKMETALGQIRHLAGADGESGFDSIVEAVRSMNDEREHMVADMVAGDAAQSILGEIREMLGLTEGARVTSAVREMGARIRLSSNAGHVIGGIRDALGLKAGESITAAVKELVNRTKCNVLFRKACAGCSSTDPGACQTCMTTTPSNWKP